MAGCLTVELSCHTAKPCVECSSDPSNSKLRHRRPQAGPVLVPDSGPEINMDYRTIKKSTVLIGLTALFFIVWGMPTAEAFIWPKIVGSADYQISTLEGEFSKTSSRSPSVDPKKGPPGSLFTVRGAWFRSFDIVESIKLGGIEVLGNQVINTDSNGEFVAKGLVIPGLDPGFYSLIITVGNGRHKTTTSSSFEVLPAARSGARGALTSVGFAPLIEAENLERAFFFQNTSKDWLFFDPRESFANKNTLLDVREGEVYWLQVKRTQTVTLNGTERTLSCILEKQEAINCWNVLVW